MPSHNSHFEEEHAALIICKETKASAYIAGSLFMVPQKAGVLNSAEIKEEVLPIANKTPMVTVILLE